MASNVLMPKMGYDMTEGKILRWIKNEGDIVAKGEPLAEIQTEKVNIEIEAFDAGILARILHEAGEDVPVGDPIAIIAQPGEEVAAPPRKAAAAPSKPAAGEPSAQPPAEAGGMRPLSPAPVTAASEEAPCEYPEGESVEYPAPRPAGGRVKASPLARRLAAERRIDLGQVRGSGPGGRIVRKDVESYRGPVAAPTPGLRVGQVPTPGATDRPVELSRMRQGIARRLTESKVAAPHFYVTNTIDMTEAVAFRSQLNQAVSEDEKASFNDLILRAVAKACAKFPSVNASWGETRLIERGEINVGIAVALPAGLVVPVLRDAIHKSLPEIARETKEIVARAKANRLRPDEMSGGTITVSNLGSYDVESYTAIINPPESAILAIGSIRKEPVVGADDQITVRSIMRITMSSDHRVIDGATAALFLAEVKRILQTPMLLLL